MKKGLGSYAFAHEILAGDLGPEAFARRAVEWGAEVIQFADNLPLENVSPETNRAVRAFGLRIETGVRGLDSERILRAAERSDTDWVRLVIDSPGDEPTPAEAIDRLGAVNDRLGGKRIAVENHDRFPARVLRDIVLASGCAVVLDTANSLGSLEGTETVATVLGDLTVCLHVKDVRPRRVPSQLGFLVEGTAAGAGAVDWATVFGHLATRCESAILETWATDPGTELEMSRTGWAWLRVQNTTVADRSPS